MLACAGAAFVFGACGGTGRDDAPLAARDCSRAQGDTARAMCLAVNAVERMDSIRAEAYAVERYGDTICVHTWPDPDLHSDMVDGEGAVAIVHGLVVRTVMGDSVPCPHRPTEFAPESLRIH
jgi:hypothetical protein